MYHMKKEIMKDGNSNKIRLTAENMKLEKLQQGDIVNVEINKIGDTDGKTRNTKLPN